MPYSFHTHSGEFCKHAVGSLHDVIGSAERRGFRQLGLSEHMPRRYESDLYEEEIELNMTPKDLQDLFHQYISTARRERDELAARCSPLSVYIGFETDFIHGDDPIYIREVAHRYDVDYLVLSVHHVHKIPTDISPELIEEAVSSAGGLSQLLIAYYDAQLALLRALVSPDVLSRLPVPEGSANPASPLAEVPDFSGVPAYRGQIVIGHIDVIHCLLDHERTHQPDIVDLERRLVQRNARAATLAGAAVEINTQGLRKGFGGPYPLETAVSAIASLSPTEIPRIVLSDDCHSPEQIGARFPDLYDWLQKWPILQGRISCFERDETGKLSFVDVPHDALVKDAFMRAEHVS